LIVMMPVLLLQITVSIVFFDRHWSKMTERLSFAVAGEMLAAVDAKNDENQKVLHDLLFEKLSLRMVVHEDQQLSMHIHKSDVDMFSNIAPFSWGYKPMIRRVLSQQLDKMTDMPYRIAVFARDKNVIVRFQVDDDIVAFHVPEGRLFSSSSYIFILWMIGLSLLFFTIAMIFMRNQIRPIYRLSLIAERLGRGITVEKIRPSGASEVRLAAAAFIKMQARIRNFIDQRTTMLAGVSHDLRTPLTRMKLQLEMMDDNPDTRAIRGDIKDMEAMIDGYLSFAKGDGGEEMMRSPLRPFIEKMADDAKRMGVEVSVSYDKNYDHDAMIWVKPVAFTRAFDNFISNASSYATSLYITVHASDDNDITIVIEDNGPGVEPHQIHNLVKPFYRGEKSRNQKTGGVGLGLTIANDIIIGHGGHVDFCQSSQYGGLKVSVTLPC